MGDLSIISLLWSNELSNLSTSSVVVYSGEYPAQKSIYSSYTKQTFTFSKWTTATLGQDVSNVDLLPLLLNLDFFHIFSSVPIADLLQGC